jgi:hypothetical protein
MLRDTLVGLIEPMLSSAGAYPLALRTEPKQSSDDRPPCLENPRPEGAESTLTENAASPFHAEPKHDGVINTSYIGDYDALTSDFLQQHGGFYGSFEVQIGGNPDVVAASAGND